MHDTQLKAEHFAFDMEGFDLAPVVAEKLAYAHDAGKNLVKDVRSITFGKNFAPLRDMHHRTGGVEAFLNLPTGHPCGAGLGGRGNRSAMKRRLCRHRCLLKGFHPFLLVADIRHNIRPDPEELYLAGG